MVLSEEGHLAVTPQPFEADVLGAPVWRLEIEPDTLPDPRALVRLIERARAQGVALLAARFPVDAMMGPRFARAGFRQIECLLTFRRDLGGGNVPHVHLTLANPGDAEACAAIALRAFSFDRFHADPKLPKSAADEIKARWARNGVNGRADAPLVVREDGAVAGFNLCMRKGEDAVIDLIAVDPARQGRGLGRRLVDGALVHYSGSARTMWVSTQEANAASVALYKSAGFELHSAAQTWHWTP